MAEEIEEMDMGDADETPQQPTRDWKDIADKTRENAFPNVKYLGKEQKATLKGKVLVFLDVAVRKGTMGDYVIALANDGTEDICFSMSGVVARQLINAKKAKMLPVRATIVEGKSKEGRVYNTLQ